MIVRVGARLLASPFQLLPLPAWHLFNLSFLSLSATVIIVGVAVIMHKLTVVATWIGEGDRSTGWLMPHAYHHTLFHDSSTSLL
jgi:hypothetical protein